VDLANDQGQSALMLVSTARPFWFGIRASVDPQLMVLYTAWLHLLKPGWALQAAREGHADAAQLLLKHGASVGATPT
jgi:hypothetical protein